MVKIRGFKICHRDLRYKLAQNLHLKNSISNIHVNTFLISNKTSIVQKK